MNDIMLMTAKVRGEERMRKAGRDRQGAEARRAARAQQTVPAAARGPVIRPMQWRATAAARTRPTTGR
jgi:hypothetical protein